MRVFSLTLLVLGLLLAVAPALAQQAGQTSFTLTSKQEGGSNFVWTAEGLSGNNPALIVPASTQITITAKGDASNVPHNIKVGSGAVSEMFEGAEGQVTYTFTSPATGSVDYVCTIHPTSMKGKVTVAGSEGETKDSPGLAVAGVVVALVGAALLVRRR